MFFAIKNLNLPKHHLEINKQQPFFNKNIKRDRLQRKQRRVYPFLINN